MAPEEQLKVLSGGGAWQAIQDHLDGDWDRVNELFTIPRSMFDEWADSIDLPYGLVLAEPHSWDGIYCVEDNNRWDVYVQERGIRVFEVGVFDDLVTAKREALANHLLNGIPLK